MGASEAPPSLPAIGALNLDSDGNMDVVFTSRINDRKYPRAVSIDAFSNDGKQNFPEPILAYAPTQLIPCAAGDIDSSVRKVLVTGGFYSYPPFDKMSRIPL